MKKTSALGHLICMITSDCQEDMEHKAEIREENTTESETKESKLDFNLFGIDEVFAN
jgi:hypothetical protein